MSSSIRPAHSAQENRLYLESITDLTQFIKATTTPEDFNTRCQETLLGRSLSLSQALEFGDEIGHTLLAKAARTGNTPLIRHIVQLGNRCLDIGDEVGRTPLYLAIEDNHLEAARALVELGSDVNLATNRSYLLNFDNLEYMVPAGTTPLWMACAKVRDVAFANFLLSNRACIEGCVEECSSDTQNPNADIFSGFSRRLALLNAKLVDLSSVQDPNRKIECIQTNLTRLADEARGIASRTHKNATLAAEEANQVIDPQSSRVAQAAARRAKDLANAADEIAEQISQSSSTFCKKLKELEEIINTFPKDERELQRAKLYPKFFKLSEDVFECVGKEIENALAVQREALACPIRVRAAQTSELVAALDAVPVETSIPKELRKLIEEYL
jgi:ankyrin repeat protein